LDSPDPIHWWWGYPLPCLAGCPRHWVRLQGTLGLAHRPLCVRSPAAAHPNTQQVRARHIHICNTCHQF
jgi:hypothetical protein